MAVSVPHPDEILADNPIAKMVDRARKREPDEGDDLAATSDEALNGPRPPDLDKLKRYFTESRDLTIDARTKALRALDYYDGDQLTSEELKALAKRGQPPLVTNRIKPAVNGIIGVVEKGRANPRAWPRTPNDTDAADAATDILRFVADANRFKAVKSDCFLDMLVPGTMAALVGVDQDRQVTVTQIRWEEYFFDARSRRKDFTDARFHGVAKWMYADDVAALYPDKTKAIEETVLNSVGYKEWRT